jgi:hypothetical protein
MGDMDFAAWEKKKCVLLFCMACDEYLTGTEHLIEVEKSWKHRHVIEACDPETFSCWKGAASG